jgi:hypothetical protein
MKFNSTKTVELESHKKSDEKLAYSDAKQHAKVSRGHYGGTWYPHEYVT